MHFVEAGACFIILGDVNRYVNICISSSLKVFRIYSLLALRLPFGCRFTQHRTCLIVVEVLVATGVASNRLMHAAILTIIYGVDAGIIKATISFH